MCRSTRPRSRGARSTRFNVGTGLSDDERKNPPPVGSLITFRYQELSDGGVPRFPSYVGGRFDGRWEGAAALPAVTSTAAPAQAAPSVEKLVGARYFELIDGKSSKFWEIRLKGSSFTARYGRIGTDGQLTTKNFQSEDAARKECEKLVLEKTKKGYIEKHRPV